MLIKLNKRNFDNAMAKKLFNPTDLAKQAGLSDATIGWTNRINTRWRITAKKVQKGRYIMTDLVQIQNNRVVVSSLQIAEHFDKEHKNVLRLLSSLLSSSNSGRLFEYLK